MYPRSSSYKARGSRKALITKFGIDATFGQVLSKSYAEASNGKKSWWVYKWLMNNQPINWKKKRDD